MTHHQHKTRLVTGGLSGSNNVKKDTDIVNHFIRKINPCVPYVNPHKGWNLCFSGVRKQGSFWINLAGVFESTDIQALRPLKPLKPLQKKPLKPLKPLQKKPLKPLRPLKKRKQTEKPCGYNATSLKTRLYPAQLGGFVLPSDNEAMRAHMRSCGRTALGVLASGNAPAVHDGESTPTLNGGFQSQNHGGQHG